MQIASAVARHDDTATALAEAAARLAARLGTEPGFVLAYADVRHDPSCLAAALQGSFPRAAVMGGSSCLGLMTEAGFAGGLEGPPAVGLLGIADAQGAYGVGAATFDADPRAAAAAAADAALTQAGRPYEMPALVWLCAAPGAEEEVLAGIADVLGPQVPVFGGSAADNDVSGGWWQFVAPAGCVMRKGVALAVLFPSGPLGHAFQSGYEPTGLAGTVTAARGREVLAIDGRPAACVYAGWTQGRIAAPVERPRAGTILADSTWAPLAREVGVVERMPFFLLSHPAQVTESGSLALFAELPEGTRVTLMEGTADGLVGRIGRVAREALETSGLTLGEVRGAMVIYCGGCMLAVRPRMEEVVAELRGALPGVPFLGGFTFGEQGRSLAGANLHGNLMISVVLLGA